MPKIGPFYKMSTFGKWYTDAAFKTYATCRLSVDDMLYCDDLAYRKCKKYRGTKQERKVGTLSSQEINRHGFIAELAFLRMFPGAVQPVSFEQSITPSRKDAAKPDFVLNDVPIDVKGQTRIADVSRNALHMVVAKQLEKHWNYACVVRVTTFDFVCAGFLHRDSVSKEKYQHAWRPGLWVPFTDLKSFRRIFDKAC